jgi:transcriptional regulator with XRE-family HTH domain
MSQLDVELAANGQVSKAYLSQLENGLIDQPSVHFLAVLAWVLGIPYDTMLDRAGYLDLVKLAKVKGAPTPAGDLVIDKLTPDEESALLEYLEFVRYKKMGNAHNWKYSRKKL